MASFNQGVASPTFNIHTGFWTDWSGGPVFGATITLGQQEGALLVAFLALFVNFVGTSFWRIFCFALHHLYSTEVAQDALHHQRQAILRNTANGTSGLWGFFNILWAWRRKTPVRTAYRRILPMIGFAIFCISAFGAAGTFSSRISTSMGKNVLVRSSTCGLLSSGDQVSINDTRNRLDSFLRQRANSYVKYAQDCYTSQSDLNSCNAFSTRLSNTTIMRNASCPFRDGICKSEYGNIVFDTGYLDSHVHLGLNTRPEERVVFRRVTSCAPLKSDNYSEIYSSPLTGINYTRFYYGSVPGLQDHESGLAFTYEYPELAPLILNDTEARVGEVGGVKSYTIEIVNAWTFDGSYIPETNFIPIPALQHAGADVHIAFLSADRIFYDDKIDDPWFSAHVGGFGSCSHGGCNDTLSVYLPDDSVSVLACSVQEQYCNPNLHSNDRCSPFGGSYESRRIAARLWKTKRHQSIFDWFSIIMDAGTDIAFAPRFAGAESLLAKYKLANGGSAVLPNDQWQIEMENWHAASLVATQGSIVDVAKGWPKDLEPWLVRPDNEVQKTLCNSQKIPNSGYFNFSIFGLSFTLALGTIIICLSYALEPLTSWIQRRRNLDTYSRLEWTTNEVLQLQRLAHEELGIGEWEGCTSDVPVTQGRDRLAVLDLDDIAHPRLKAPVQPFDETLPAQGGQKEATLVEVEQEHDAASATGRS